LNIISSIFNINIISIKPNEDTGQIIRYSRADNDLFNKNNSTIILLNLGNFHWEAVGKQTKDGIKTVFEYDTMIEKIMESSEFKNTIIV